MAQHIVEYVSADIIALSKKGQTIDYFTVIGGGAHLLFGTIKAMIGDFFGWNQKTMDERVIDPKELGIDCRYINCVGFMLLARDQIAMELGKDVDPHFCVNNIIKDETGEG